MSTCHHVATKPAVSVAQPHATKPAVSLCQPHATKPAVSLSESHATKPAACLSPLYSRCPVLGFPSEGELLRMTRVFFSSVFLARPRYVSSIAIIVRSFPATPSQIHYSINPNTGCYIISAAGTEFELQPGFEVVCKFELKTGRSFNACT